MPLPAMDRLLTCAEAAEVLGTLVPAVSGFPGGSSLSGVSGSSGSAAMSASPNPRSVS